MTRPPKDAIQTLSAISRASSVPALLQHWDDVSICAATQQLFFRTMKINNFLELFFS